MISASDTFVVAAVQAAPVFLDLEASTEKACALIRDAANGGADLVVFPEAFLPGYPIWTWFIPPVQTRLLRDLYAELHAQSVNLHGPAVFRICEAALQHEITVAIGINEINSEASGASLYNTLLYISHEGVVLGRHRKLIPTAAERLVWGRGNGGDLDVYDTPIGRLGGLICWEHYMPLARYALSSLGIQVHVAPTWDRGEPWTSTLRHIAKESRCPVIGCCQPFHKDDIPDRYAFKQQYLEHAPDWLNTGGSVILDPDGKILDGPLLEREGILYAEINRTQLVGPRWQLDAAGHYSRPDVFELHWRRHPDDGLRFLQGLRPAGRASTRDDADFSSA